MNNLDLNLKDTFDFIHNILQGLTLYYEEVDEAIETPDKPDNVEVIEAFDYYNDDADRVCSLILLTDSIRYVTRSPYVALTLTSQSE